MTLLEDVQTNWPLRKGKNEFISFLKGEEITRAEGMLAMCYQCSGGYESGTDFDCKARKTCPLYLWMPFASKEFTVSKKKREIKPEQLEKMKAGRERAKAKLE